MRKNAGKSDWRSTECYPKFPSSFDMSTGRAEYPNPGNIEELHSLTNKIMPKMFDGIELSILSCLAPNKHLALHWILSHTIPSGFKVGGVYSIRRFNDVLETPLIYADINPASFSSNFGFLYYPSKNVRLAVDLQKSSALFYKKFSAELYSPSTTYSVNFYNPSKKRGYCTFSFLRSARRHFVLGTELVIEWDEPTHTKADLALAMRYSRHKHSTALTVSRQGFDISHWERIHNSIQMGTLLAFNRNTRNAIGSICYQWESNNTTVRGILDSDMFVGFMYYRILAQFPCAFGLSLLFGIPLNRFTFGIKLDLDPYINCQQPSK